MPASIDGGDSFFSRVGEGEGEGDGLGETDAVCPEIGMAPKIKNAAATTSTPLNL